MIKVSIVEEYERFSYQTIFPVLPNKGDSIGVSNIEDDFIEEYKVIDLFFVLCSQNKNLEDIQIVVSKK
jgi:hypothetical protein